MLRFIRENKSGIIVGLITTIIFIYLLQPILGWVGERLLFVAYDLNHAYIDRIYAQAAMLTTQNYSFILFTVAAYIFGFSVFSASLLMLLPRQYTQIIYNILNGVQKSGGKLPLHYQSKIRRYTIGSIGILTFVWMTLDLSGNYLQLNLISTFNQDMRIISPYINDQQRSKIISEWSLMKGKSDYLVVYAQIDKIAKQNNIELPENKIFTWSAI